MYVFTVKYASGLRVTQLVNKGQQSMTLDDNPDLTWPEKPPVNEDNKCQRLKYVLMRRQEIMSSTATEC